jgi:hypothetical protein
MNVFLSSATVAEARGLAGAPAPIRKFFPAPPLYKIIKILLLIDMQDYPRNFTV